MTMERTTVNFTTVNTWGGLSTAKLGMTAMITPKTMITLTVMITLIDSAGQIACAALGITHLAQQMFPTSPVPGCPF